jgi:hypothetical protein
LEFSPVILVILLRYEMKFRYKLKLNQRSKQLPAGSEEMKGSILGTTPPFKREGHGRGV